MTELLVKLFVKDNQNIENIRVRTCYGLMVSIVGIVCNMILFSVKLAIGTIINSISVTSDAFNNLSDAASGIVSFVGVKLAGNPADKEHPFGHGRFEHIAALAVAFLIIQVGIGCFKDSFSKVIHPQEVEYNTVLIVVLGLTVLIKLWLGLFNKKLGNRIQSSVMKATAGDSFSDVMITGATILSMLVGRMTGWDVDGYMGVLVSIAVLFSGIGIIKDTLQPLLGEAVDDALYEQITEKVESYSDIIGSHDLIVHQYGPSHTMATIHAEVPNDIDIEKAHETIDQIERDVLTEMNIFLVIHMDPIAIHDERLNYYREIVETEVFKITKEVSMHDFRIVNGEKHVNLIFDLVVPHSWGALEKENVAAKIKQEIAKKNPACECVITVEHSYISQKK